MRHMPPSPAATPVMIIIGPKTTSGATSPPLWCRTSARMGANRPASTTTTDNRNKSLKGMLCMPRRTVKQTRAGHKHTAANTGLCQPLNLSKQVPIQPPTEFRRSNISQPPISNPYLSLRTSHSGHDAGTSESHSTVLGRVQLWRDEIHDRPGNSYQDRQHGRESRMWATTADDFDLWSNTTYCVYYPQPKAWGNFSVRPCPSVIPA